MQNKDRSNSETFCVLPWVHTATYTDGTALLCCVSSPNTGVNLNHSTINDAKNSDYFKEARLSLLNGEKFRGCSVCWREEEVGVSLVALESTGVLFAAHGAGLDVTSGVLGTFSASATAFPSSSSLSFPAPHDAPAVSLTDTS